MNSNHDKQSTLTALSPEWIIPIDATYISSESLANRKQWLEGYTLVFNEQQIVDLLPNEEFSLKYPTCETSQRDGCAVMPGLINAHCHAAMSLLRGFSDDLPLHQWLETAIWPAESKFVDDNFVVHGTQLAIAEMLRGGTTCFQDMYFMPDQIAKTVQNSGIRANIGLMVVDSETVWARDAEECIKKGLDVYDNFKHHSKLSFSFAPHAPYTVSRETLQKIGTLSFELGLNVQMHLHETLQEVSEYHEQHDVRPIEQLYQQGLLSPQLNAVHMTQLSKQEINWIAESKSHVVHCPQSNMKLASGCCPVGSLLDAGVNVAIGTDGAASNNDLDMFAELQSAAMLAKLDRLDPTCVSAFDALSMATMGGAKALGLADNIGSITIGKQADLIVVDLNQLETQPVFSPISQIVYAACRNQVTDVWVGGKQLLKNRKLTTLNEASIVNNANVWRDKIAGEI